MNVLGRNAYTQKITYWTRASEDGFGNYTFSSPQLLWARWEDRVEIFTDLSGTERRSKAIVFTDQPLITYGYLFKGESNASDPTTVDAWIIQRFDEVPDLRGLNVCYRAFL